MRIARPPEGFRIVLSAPVQALLQSKIDADAGFATYWADIVERLKFTAHREGEPDVRLGNGFRIWTGQGGPNRGRVRLVYRVLGDRVEVRMASFG